jgi:hypothetical protein
MKSIWTNEGLWVRIGVVVSLVWIMVMLATVAFFATQGNVIQLLILGLVGIGLIIIICIGVPWIASVVDKKPATDKKLNDN